MSGLTQGGRSELVLKVRATGDGKMALVSPTVGVWRGGPPVGNFVSPDSTVGILDVLGKPHVLRAPDEAQGQVVATAAGIATQTAVEFGEELLVLDPSATTGPLSAAPPGSIHGGEQHGAVLVAPSSGRFYARPAPDEEPFVKQGDIVEQGQTVGLLEVMKTFHRIGYGGDGVPIRGRILKALVQGGDDVDAGQPLFEIERAD
jgi:acetyl-CoA carboxylase biotin carboxyl carrier protein